jgi:hypothetical protein
MSAKDFFGREIAVGAKAVTLVHQRFGAVFCACTIDAVGPEDCIIRMDTFTTLRRGHQIILAPEAKP